MQIVSEITLTGKVRGRSQLFSNKLILQIKEKMETFKSTLGYPTNHQSASGSSNYDGFPVADEFLAITEPTISDKLFRTGEGGDFGGGGAESSWDSGSDSSSSSSSSSND